MERACGLDGLGDLPNDAFVRDVATGSDCGEQEVLLRRDDQTPGRIRIEARARGKALRDHAAHAAVVPLMTLADVVQQRGDQ